MPLFNTFKFAQEKFGEKPPRYAHLPTRNQQVLGAQGRKKFANYLVYRIRYNKQEQMKYYTPTNPQTVDQQANRSKFAAAVANWQGLTENQKNTWRKRALGTTIPGYNLYLREQMKI